MDDIVKCALHCNSIKKMKVSASEIECLLKVAVILQIILATETHSFGVSV
jgi:hypothetical protein